MLRNVYIYDGTVEDLYHDVYHDVLASVCSSTVPSMFHSCSIHGLSVFHPLSIFHSFSIRLNAVFLPHFGQFVNASASLRHACISRRAIEARNGMCKFDRAALSEKNVDTVGRGFLNMGIHKTIGFNTR